MIIESLSGFDPENEDKVKEEDEKVKAESDSEEEIKLNRKSKAKSTPSSSKKSAKSSSKTSKQDSSSTPKKPKRSKPKTPSKKKIDEGEDNESEVEKFSLPGQKLPSPPMGDGTRAFYESLLQQKPDSVMAQEWCLRYGVLPLKKAEEIFAALDVGSASAKKAKSK